MIRLALYCILIVGMECMAQAPVLGPVPDPCPDNHLTYKPPVMYPWVREADLIWSKRVWRTLDMREKLNQPLYYPLEPSQCRMSLFDALKEGIRNGEIIAYGRPVIDDEFGYPLSIVEALKLFTGVDTVLVQDINDPTQFTKKEIPTEVGSDKITRYWIKEDWFFDKQRSVMEVRIIGICPLMEKMDENGEFRAYQPLFWVYFPECRKVLATKPVLYHAGSMGAMPSMDAVFHKRLFSSFIHKESNVYDRTIAEYSTGIDALLESERIKNNIFEMEHDMWQY